MVVLKDDVTAENVLNDSEHGLRRWLHKLRRDDNFQRSAERITWITILGVSVSYSGEAIFKKVAAMHGTILALHKCSLEGNQNIGYGRVHIHMIKKSLIREDLNVIVNGKVHKVSMVEEVRDITNFELQKGEAESSYEDIKEGDKEMQVNDEDDEEEKGDEDEEANSDKDSDKEEGGEAKVKYGDGNGPISATGGHFAREDEGSRFSSETRVGETFEVDSDSLKTKTYGEDERVYGEYNGNSFFNGVGNKCNNEDDINMEKQNNDLSLADGIKETNMGNKKRCDGNGTVMGDFRPGGEQMLDKSTGLVRETSGTNGNNSSNPINKINMSGNRTRRSDQHNRQENDTTNTERIDELEHNSAKNRREKREVSLSSSVGSSEDTLRKKRKARSGKMFEGDVVEINFNQGKINEIISENKKKIGRRSVKKAKEVARKTGVEGLGENKKGVSDAYKEYYKAESESNEVFHFGNCKVGEVDSSRCN
ncbi:hypothetical protein Tco_0627126 [Tanacetum coccineum]|uniref:RRM domain-containing protein n=1 Tax=Tanacetum coccineum TaxID=301880 RepID=A0ABQ4WLL0_9ASTR